MLTTSLTGFKTGLDQFREVVGIINTAINGSVIISDVKTLLGVLYGVG